MYSQNTHYLDLDFTTVQVSNMHISAKRSYSSFYLMAMVTFVIFVNNYEIFSLNVYDLDLQNDLELWNDLDLLNDLDLYNGPSSTLNMPIKRACHSVNLIDNSSTGPICHYLQTECAYFDMAYNGPKSNVNTRIKRPYSTSHLMILFMFALSVTIYKMLAVEMCMTLTLTF